MEMLEEKKTVDEAILSCIEQFWGFGLPLPYRIFLKTHNGGTPCKRNFNFKEKSEGSVIAVFFGLEKGNNNLLIQSRDMGIRYPNTMLPIADDVFGNRILIVVKGSNRGKIYFWDHEMEADEGEVPDYSNLTLIADSFDKFFDSLFEAKEVQ